VLALALLGDDRWTSSRLGVVIFFQNANRS